MHPTNTTHIPKQETDTFEISPTLEMEHPASLSTHWIPLDELIALWTDRDLLLSRTPMAALLAAIGHALLALARESRALQRYTLAWQRREDAPVHETSDRFNQVGHSLHEATHQWHRAAMALESLSPTDAGRASPATRPASRTSRPQPAAAPVGTHHRSPHPGAGVAQHSAGQPTGGGALRVCLWCGLSLPHGACIVVCPKHVGFVRWQAARQTPRRTTVVRPDTKERSEP